MAKSTMRTTNEIDKRIGARLRVARKAADMSQKDLAKAIGASFQQIQKYEQGINRVSSSLLFKIAQILDLPIMYFYEGIDAATSAKRSDSAQDEKRVEEYVQSKHGRALIKRYLAIHDPEIRKLVLKILDTFGGR